MSSSYDSSRSRRRGAWGHWVPLVLTVAVASAGVAAWVWNQRSKDDDEEEELAHAYLDYGHGDYGENPPYGATGSRTLEEAEARKIAHPSPFPSPSPTLSPPPSQVSTRRRKTVAVVVSADSGADDFSDDGFHEHASILSHIPRNTDFSAIKLFVLVYSPGLKESALEAQTGGAGGGAGATSLSSSFSNIDPENAHTPGSEKSPQLKSTADSAFTALYSQALGLVEKETMVMPFTSPNGHVHILRHLQPEVVYLQESLAGDNGNYVMQLQTWLRHDVILIVGADGSGGGLADSDSEGPGKPEEKEDIWWEREERVGRGRGVVVVDSLMVSDDWERRVLGKE